MQLFKVGGKIAIEVINKVAANKSGHKQEGEGNYDSWPNKLLVKKLRNKGTLLIRLRDYVKAIYQ